MNEPPLPLHMSVLLVTPDDFSTIRETIRHLHAQTIRRRLELLIICPSRSQLRLDDGAVRGFGAVRVVEVGPIRSASVAKVAALAQVSTPYVACAEDHCYPGPNWAAALLAAHTAGHAVVGPAVENANPTTTLSWANFIACFGRWTGPLATGEIEQTPYHNTSYRRELLTGFGEALPGLFAMEHFLQQSLRDQGHRPFLTADTRVRHINFSRVRPWLVHAYLGGRLFGGTRWQREQWSGWKRAVYVLGSPLIPAIRLWRTIPAMRRDPSQWARWPAVLPWLALGLVVHAVGEMAGYLLGLGDTEERYSRLESRRLDHVTASDRLELATRTQGA